MHVMQVQESAKKQRRIAYLWHLIVFNSHGDHVDTDDTRYGHVKVLARDDRMQIEAWLRIQRPIGWPQ